MHARRALLYWRQAMTVSTVVDHNDYTGNGVTTSFPYTFRIFKKTDLTVSVIDLSENISTLVLDTDYTVTNAGGYNGGNVVLTSPLASGWKISLARELEATQETDLRNQGKFFAEVHEDAFDKLTMLIQQVGTMFSLALRKPSTIANWYDALGNYIRNLHDPRDPQDASTKNYVDNNLSKTLRVPESIPRLPDAATRANKMPAFDSAGNPIVVIPPSGSASDVMIELAKPTGSSHIGYQYPADGSVPRTVEDKLGDFVSVLDFGAKGDGVTDDSIAFRDAIATGKTVYVPDTSGNNLGCVYKVSGIDVTTIKLVGESQRVEIQPVSTATRILNLKGTSPASPARGCFIRNITFSSPATSEGLFHDAVLLENTNQCDVSNVTLYLVQLTVLGHNYLRLDKINGIGARLSVSRHSGDSIDNAVGLLLKDSFLAYNSEVDIRNSTDTRIVDTYIANSKSDGRTGLNHDYDAEFLPGGSVFFGGVLMITNVICECVCVIKYTALSKFTGFWAGAFHGNGLTLLNSYGLLATNCTFHYSTGAGVYARNLTDCTFISSSFTNSQGGGFDLDNSVRTTFVACTFSKFELYE